MKHENKRMKQLIACVMCAVMIGSAISCMPEVSVSATENSATETSKQSYEEWQEALPVNGSFEVGYDGEEVYGWSKTGMDYGSDKKREDAGFEAWYTLTTAVEDGNKVAALEKKGAGYVAATSSAARVTGGTNYRVSFDYRTAVYTIKDTANANGTEYYGVRLYVEELAADGTSLGLTRYYTDASNTNTWQTGVAEFTTQTSTDSVIIYLWMGGGFNMYATVYFDNVELEEIHVNGDFEYGTVGEDVPCWTETAMKDGASKDPDNTVAYCNSYTIKTVAEDENKVAAVNKNGSGYIAATSEEIQVTGAQNYRVSFDYKTTSVTTKANATTGLTYFGVRLYIEELDADGNIVKALTEYFKDATATTYDWRNATIEFETQTTTDSVVLYLWMGGQWNMYATAYFDDVVVEEVELLNADFEYIPGTTDGGTSGGTSVNSWTKTAFETSNAKTTDATRAEGFLNAYTATTAVEDNGNKAASLQKIGAGYVGLTSNAIPVYGLHDYKVSVDYKTAVFSPAEDSSSATGDDYYGFRLLLEEQDATGNTLSLKEYNRDSVNSAAWQTMSAELETQKDTAVVIIYLWVGGGYQRRDTFYFDNVTFNEIGFGNADFEEGTAGSDVPGWSKTSMEVNSNTVASTDYASSFTLQTVVEDDNKVASFYKGGSGYAAVTSNHLPVLGAQDYHLSFDYKTVSVTYKSSYQAGDNGTDYFGVRLLVEEFDANGASLGMTRPYEDSGNTATWQTGTVEFKTQADTVSIVIYLWMGGQWNMYATVYFDNVVVEKVVETDLLFVMLEGGNANKDAAIDVSDLVRMKKHESDNTTSIHDSADMNRNLVINQADRKLLRWKLLGVTTTEQAQAIVTAVDE